MADPPNEQTWLHELEDVVPRLQGWVYLRLREDATVGKEDFVQEVLYRAYESRSRFRGESVRAWVFQIAKHVLLETMRRRRRAGRVLGVDGHTSRFAALHEIPAAVTTMTRRVAREDECRHLLAAVADLDDTDRRLVLLCGLEGESVRTAALQVGLSEEATAKRWYRLRQRLRREHGGDEGAAGTGAG